MEMSKPKRTLDLEAKGLIYLSRMSVPETKPDLVHDLKHSHDTGQARLGPGQARAIQPLQISFPYLHLHIRIMLMMRRPMLLST